MSTLTNNKNFLNPVGFQFKINSGKYANIEYFCIAASLPSVNLPPVSVPFKGVNISATGDKLQFEDLTLRINVTENMENYIETFNWINNILQSGTAENNKEDATLMILSSHNNVNKEIEFKGIFPTGISGVEFNTQTTDIEFVQVDITFSYNYFEIK